MLLNNIAMSSEFALLESHLLRMENSCASLMKIVVQQDTVLIQEEVFAKTEDKMMQLTPLQTTSQDAPTVTKIAQQTCIAMNSRFALMELHLMKKMLVHHQCAHGT